jgi:hypothetical protein
MGQSRTVREWLNSARREPPSSRGLPAIVASMVAVPIPVLAWLLPPSLVLPISSLVLLSCAAVVALFAWLRSAEPGSPGITLWDLAGAFAFIALAAGGLSEPIHVAHLFGVALPAP